MRLLATLAAAAALGGGTLVNTSQIGGAHVGMTPAQVRTVFGGPSRLDHLEGGRDRLEFPRRKVDVYFRAGGSRATAIVAWSSRFRTAKGIGPCSTEAELKAAYPGLARVLSGPERVYRLASTLFFDVETGRVQAVALGAGTSTPYLAANAPGCNQG